MKRKREKEISAFAKYICSENGIEQVQSQHEMCTQIVKYAVRKESSIFKNSNDLAD